MPKLIVARRGRLGTGRRAADTRCRKLRCETLEPRYLLSVLSDQVELIGRGVWSGPGGNLDSVTSSISDDGRYVAFCSHATNFVPLLPGDNNYSCDVFHFDRNTDSIRRVTHGYDGSESNRGSFHPAISGDGRYVAFESDSDNLVPGDTNYARDVFVCDTLTDTIERVSVASDGTQADAACRAAAISGDGRYVAFHSYATNLVAGDDNGFKADIFVYDRQTDTLECVSLATDGSVGNGFSTSPSISGDGRFVAFESWAYDLVPGDANNRMDVFVYDRQTDSMEMVSRASTGVQGNDQSQYPAISADGRCVVFRSTSDNLVPNDSNNWYDVFVYDRQTDVIERVSVASDGTQADRPFYGELPIYASPSINGDGSLVAFGSYVDNLVPGDTNDRDDVFVYDHLTHTMERASVAADGAQAGSPSCAPSISAWGHCVSFYSDSTNFVELGFGAGWTNVFVKGVAIPVLQGTSGNDAFEFTAGAPGS